MPVADDFDRARMQMQDEILHDVRLSPATRLVGIEILRCVNRACGYAWPGNKLLVERLGVDRSTVQAATGELERVGWFRIKPVAGSSNQYWPRFVEEGGRKFRPPLAEGLKKPASGAEIYGPTRGENPAQSPLRNSNISPSKGRLLKRTGQPESLLRARPGDQEVERRVSKQLGIDGDDVLSVLHSIDDGAPYYRLIAAAREEPLDAAYLAAARATYEAQGASLPRRRAQGGRS